MARLLSPSAATRRRRAPGARDPGGVVFVARRDAGAESPGGAPARDPAAFGVLAELVADPAATDVFVNPDGAVWWDRGAGAAPVAGMRVPADEARDLAVRLVSLGGRHIDEATPAMDVRLGDGVRVHAVLPPVSPGGAALSIRLQRPEPLSARELAEGGAFADVPLDGVRDLVLRRANLLVTGAGGSGKTTLLGALLGLAPPHERIVVVEDVAELRVRHPHVVSLEARQPNLDGAGAVGLERLVREALRMRPDRLVVGEVRGAELRELLAALNTGHDGGAGTLHANSLADVPARLEALGALAGLGAEALARQAVSAIDAVLHLERTRRGRRLSARGALRLDRRGRLAVEEA
jgi:pilus assembly protein CpaF